MLLILFFQIVSISLSVIKKSPLSHSNSIISDLLLISMIKMMKNMKLLKELISFTKSQIIISLKKI